MVQLKDYITLRVLVLFTFELLSANNIALKDVPGDATGPSIVDTTVPRIVKGPGQILSVSKKSRVRSNEDTNTNDMLYQIYKKWYHSDNENRQHKKGAIIETDTLPQKTEAAKKTVESTTHIKKDVEKHKMALRELEGTIDKLIDSLTKVSNDGKFDEKKINKGIEDLSKFADLSHLSMHASKDDHAKEKSSEEIEHFDDFKARFYDTFLATNPVKRQKIVYHGKKDVTPRIVYHGKDHDKKSVKKNTNAISGDRMRELADLYEELKKQTATEQAGIDLRKSLLYNKRKVAGRKRSARVDMLRKDLLSLFDTIYDYGPSDGSVQESMKKTVAVPAQQVDNQLPKNTNVEKLKKDLNSLFDVISNNDGGRGGNAKGGSVHDDKSSVSSSDERYASKDLLKKQLLSVVTSLETKLKENPAAPPHRNPPDSLNKRDASGKVIDRFESDLVLDNVVPEKKSQSQDQLKRELLSVVRSLEAEIGNENVIKHEMSDDGGDHFDSDLDHIVSRKTVSSDNNYTLNEFVDALKGFARPASKKSKF